MLKWLKRIFSLQTLSILGTLGGIYFGITQFRHDTGGDLNASYNTELLRNNEYRDLIVFTDSKEFSINNLCPNFNNTDKYTLKDFNLQHTVETQNIQVFKTDFYTSFKLSDNTSALKYYDNSLSPHQSAENPISKIIMDSQKGSCLITSRATWDGADKPFIFKANINFTHFPHTPNESFENWKRKCKEYTAENFKLHIYDAIYLSSKGEDRDYNVSISPETSSSSITISSKEEVNENKATTLTSPKATETATVTEQKVNVAEKSVIQDIFIADSTINQTGNTYTIHYKVDQTTDAFVVYYYSFRGSKDISGTLHHFRKSSNQFLWTFVDSKLISILGVAEENPSLQEYISIKGYNLKNNHPSKHIGINAYIKENGKVISKLGEIIRPNSSTTFSCKEGTTLEDIQYYEFDEQILNSVPEYQLYSQENKDKQDWFWIILSIVIPLCFLPFIPFILEFIDEYKLRKSFKVSWHNAFENVSEGIIHPWNRIIFYISTTVSLVTIIILLIAIIRLILFFI